jgi:hypothetical protein
MDTLFCKECLQHSDLALVGVDKKQNIGARQLCHNPMTRATLAVAF